MKKILAVAHQYGGANVIGPVIKNLNNFYRIEILTLGYGFSADSFKKAGIEFSVPEIIYSFYDEKSLLKTASKILDYEKPDLILCGTSDGFNLEKALIIETRKKNITSIGILDNWTNFDKRFCSKYLIIDETLIPTYLCIMDDYCYNELTRIGYDSNRLEICGHPYLEMLLSSFKNISASKLKESLGIKQRYKVITFISEPHSEDYGDNGSYETYKGFTEYDVLKCLTNQLNKLVSRANINFFLIIKLHPRENTKDYSPILKYALFPYKILFDEFHCELFSLSDIIIGMESIFLIESAMFGIPTISLQPGLLYNDNLFSNNTGLTIPIYDCEGIHEQVLSLINKKKNKKKTSYQLKHRSVQLITELVFKKIL